MGAQCIHGVDGFFSSPNSAGPNSDFSTWTLAGQTFTANTTGNVTSISVGVGSKTVAGTHEFRISGSTNPPTSEIGGVAYQTFTTSGGAETVTINLSLPFPVIASTIYAFDITFGDTYHPLSTNLSQGSDYDGGQYYQLFGSFSTFSTFNTDNNFEVCISPASSGAADVPTLSEWGLLILALLLMTLGTVYLLQPSLEQEY